MPLVKIPVSIGDLFDRVSILEIKLNRVKSEEQLENVQKEMDMVGGLFLKYLEKFDEDHTLFHLYLKLSEVNECLWDIEDNIRDLERQNIFDETFIELAREVYYNNDCRAAIKKEINIQASSDLIEEKDYSKY